ncbi:hypothetical protein QTN25_009865 [Entamoeba marina]
MSDIVVKLEYMNDIRISLLNSITINELYAAFQKKFNLKDMRLRPRFLLKYLDLDGDWITLTEDSDIHIALQQLKQTTMRLKLVDSYQTANSSTNEEWDLRPLFSQLLHSPSIQTSISKMVENILLTSNQVVEVRTKPDTVKMPLNYKATISDHEPLPVLDDEIWNYSEFLVDSSIMSDPLQVSTNFVQDMWNVSPSVFQDQRQSFLDCLSLINTLQKSIDALCLTHSRSSTSVKSDSQDTPIEIIMKSFNKLIIESDKHTNATHQTVNENIVSLMKTQFDLFNKELTQIEKEFKQNETKLKDVHKEHISTQICLQEVYSHPENFKQLQDYDEFLIFTKDQCQKSYVNFQNISSLYYEKKIELLKKMEKIILSQSILVSEKYDEFITLLKTTLQQQIQQYENNELNKRDGSEEEKLLALSFASKQSSVDYTKPELNFPTVKREKIFDTELDTIMSNQGYDIDVPFVVLALVDTLKSLKDIENPDLFSEVPKETILTTYLLLFEQGTFIYQSSDPMYVFSTLFIDFFKRLPHPLVPKGIEKSMLSVDDSFAFVKNVTFSKNHKNTLLFLIQYLSYLHQGLIISSHQLAEIFGPLLFGDTTGNQWLIKAIENFNEEIMEVHPLKLTCDKYPERNGLKSVDDSLLHYINPTIMLEDGIGYSKKVCKEKDSA